MKTKAWPLAAILMLGLAPGALAAEPVGYVAPDGVNTVPVTTATPLPVTVNGQTVYNGASQDQIVSAPGTTGVQQVGGANVTAVLVPAVQSAAYATGNCVGGFNAVTLAQFNGQSGIMTNLRLSSLSGLTTGVTVYLFDANPSASTCTDKGTFTLNAADVDKLIVAPFAMNPGAPTGTAISFAGQTNMGLPLVAGGSATSGVKTVYVGLVANGSMTPASTSDIHLRLGAVF